MGQKLEHRITYIGNEGDVSKFKIEEGFFAGIEYHIEPSEEGAGIQYKIINPELLNDVFKNAFEQILHADLTRRAALEQEAREEAEEVEQIESVLDKE